MTPSDWAVLLGPLLGAGAGSYFGLKGALNGMKATVSDIKATVGETHTIALETRVQVNNLVLREKECP